MAFQKIKSPKGTRVEFVSDMKDEATATNVRKIEARQRAAYIANDINAALAAYNERMTLARETQRRLGWHNADGSLNVEAAMAWNAKNNSEVK